MKQNPDSYLLYEANKFITYNIRIKLVMTAPVNVTALKKAAQIAFKRFPYYAKEIKLLADGSIDLIPNGRPLTVAPVAGAHTRLGTADVNFHLCSIEYEGDTIYFNMYHGLCGGCGVMFWIKSTLYHYVQEAFGVTLEKGCIKTADTPFAPGETDYPDPDKLPNDLPVGTVKKDLCYIPAMDYAKQILKTPRRDSRYFELELETKDFMKYARRNDGSPNSILSSLMFKAMCKVTSPSVAKAIRGNILCNYRADVGCPETYHDLIRLLSIYYPRELEFRDTEYLSTITRSMMYLQMQPEFSVASFRETFKSKSGIDTVRGLTKKKLYAMSHSSFTKPPVGSFLISYVGKEDWAGLEEYIARIHCITDGHLMVEVNTLRDKFYLTFMEMNTDHKFYDAFCEAMREVGIRYKEFGGFDRHLAFTVLPKKSL